MAIDKTLNCFRLIFLISLLMPRGAFAVENARTFKNAAQIVKEKGKIVVDEAETWNTDKKILKDWVTLKNRYFTISYPKCINPEGDGGEDDPKLAPAVAFSAKSACIDFSKELGSEYLFEISYEDGISPKSEIINIGEKNNLKTQNITLNGNAAKFFTIIMNSNIGDSSGTLIQMRQKIYLLCGEKVMSITYDSPRGDISLQKIEKSEFEFPDNLKKIVSTFQCPKNKKKH
jgi:hypothetical protein